MTWRGSADRSRVARLILAVLAGGGVGGLLQYLVPHLSFTLEPLANTAAPFVLVTLAVALSARWMGESLTLAILTLLALVLGFYFAQLIRGWAVSAHQVAFWIASSALVGPLVGLAAGWLRRAGPSAAGLGAGIVGGMFVGESLHGLIDLRYVSAAGYWDVQMAIGIGLMLGLTLWRCRDDWSAAVGALSASTIACVVVGAGTLIAYAIPT